MRLLRLVRSPNHVQAENVATIKLDLAGLKCPLPALRTKKALATLRAGDLLYVRCTDAMAAIDIPHLVNQTGHRLVDCGHHGAELTFLIE